MKDRTLVGQSAAMESLRDSIARTAPTGITVLIQGETGTGKELVARAIHRESRRANGPFVAVNCASLPENLIESELFGYRKGAFTGADSDRKGRFELAQGGTLFLDEIGETSLPFQAKLLRVLEEREIDKVGGLAPIRIDCRLIAATNRDLERMVVDGTFRADLFYRLYVDCIHTPSLRERREDIPELAHHFAMHYARELSRSLSGVSEEVLDVFLQYSWPGNVRELQNVIQRAVLKGDGDLLMPEDLPTGFLGRAIPASVKLGTYHKTMHDFSRRLLDFALEAASGNASKAAQLLDLNRTSFYRIAGKHRSLKKLPR